MLDIYISMPKFGYRCNEGFAPVVPHRLFLLFALAVELDDGFQHRNLAYLFCR